MESGRHRLGLEGLTFTRLLSAFVFALAFTSAMCAAADEKAGRMDIKCVPGQAELGTVEIHGVGAGDFRPDLWEANKLNFVPDVRSPLIEPRKRGLFRNIYAPSIVDLGDQWRVFYGAWDGVDSGNDRIYSVNTRDFLDFGDRQTVIKHGDFIHCCNVNAIRLPSGEYRLMCTVYPDANDLNKPATFTSPDGVKWNGCPAPYPAKKSDIITLEGYDKFKDADINGMNVILYEDGVFRLYFNNFKDFGPVFRATSKNGKDYKFDGVVLGAPGVVNDVKKLQAGGKTWYLMALHMNTDKMWYSLSNDGRTFRECRDLARNLGDKDRYMVAVGWVVRGNRVLGFLYGACPVPSVDRNRIYARWLQKKVIFVGDDGARYEAKSSLGPDRQIIEVPQDKQVNGHFEVYAEDGASLIADDISGTLIPGAVYVISEPR